MERNSVMSKWIEVSVELSPSLSLYAKYEGAIDNPFGVTIIIGNCSFFFREQACAFDTFDMSCRAILHQLF
jgi:hypothetical protein